MFRKRFKKREKKVLFILGSGHCGSSLISVILGNHSQIVNLGELKGLSNPKRRQAILDSAYLKKCALHDICPLWDKKVNQEYLRTYCGLRIHKNIPLKVERFYRELFRTDLYFNLYTYLFTVLPHKNMIIDKSLTHKWFQKRLNAKEINSGQIKPYLLYLLRDGRAIVNSYKRKYAKTYQDIATGWAKGAIQKEIFYKNFCWEKRKIKYEDFCTSPENTLIDICRTLDIDYSQEMLSDCSLDQHPISGNGKAYKILDSKNVSINLDDAWRKNITDKDEKIFHDVAGDINKELGYE